MIDTLLLLALLFCLAAYFVYIITRQRKFTKTSIVVFICGLVLFFILVYITGFEKVEKDIARVIHNSSPKSADDVYTLLFKKSIDSCVTFINFKDQVIPKIDCCIWMELKLCPAELKRIIRLRKYAEIRFRQSDSLDFLKTFGDRPQWWKPQVIGDSVIKLIIKFDADNEQVLFFARDSSHVFICDKAL
ncbi:MAG: hypothetical protein ABI666_05420 [Ferruginibacter sp.]